MSEGNIIETRCGGEKLILTLIATLALTVKHEAQPVQVKSPIQIEHLQAKPTKRPDFDIEILTPLRSAQAAKQAELDKLAAEEAERVRQAQIVPQTVYTPTYTSYGESPLIAGTHGWLDGGNNCVSFVKQFRSVPFNNPITWGISTRTPYIGALALFPYNHVAYVVGIHADGSVEVAHANAPGAPTRYYLSQLRGFL